MTHQRIRSLPEFLGRFEQLEARTVLSVAPGSAAYEVFESNTDFLKAAPQFDLVDSLPAGHFDPPNFPGFNHSEFPDHISIAGYRQQELIDHFFVISVSYRTPQFARSSEPAASTEDTNTAVPPPLAAQAPPDDRDYTADLEIPPAPLTDTPWFSSSLAAESTSVLTEVADVTEINNHDLAFQTYWSEAALPTVGADHQDDDFDAFADLSALDEDAEEENEPGERAEGDAKSLLEVLNLELAAIDSVLSQLHEFKFQHNQETARHEAEQRSNDRSPQPDVALLLPVEQAPTDEEVADLSEGGMVLLETDGTLDETSNIVAVFAQAMDRAGTKPLGVEISAGIYQAFEVGSSSTAKANPVVSKSISGQSDLKGSQTESPHQKS